MRIPQVAACTLAVLVGRRRSLSSAQCERIAVTEPIRTFENTYRHYAFWPLVELGLGVGRALTDMFPRDPTGTTAHRLRRKARAQQT